MMKQNGSATYKRYVRREDETSYMPINGMLLPIRSKSDERRIEFTLDDGSVLDFSEEPTTAASPWTWPMLIGTMLLFLYLVISGVAGAMDGPFPQGSGSSLIARAEQASPTYLLMRWLTQPRNRAY